MSGCSRRAAGLADLDREVVACCRCPRLVRWREAVARNPRAGFRDEVYWGRPIPGFGPTGARLLVVGLAPAAHGGNRTGRIFTGDRSGDWLFRALWRAGFANRPESRCLDDGLVLRDARITAAVRCAPPANRPAPDEESACRPFLVREIELLRRLEIIVCLGGFAWRAVRRALAERGHPGAGKGVAFGHGVEVKPSEGAPRLLLSYHPSQQNTFTGRLTESMLDAVFGRAAALLGRGAAPAAGLTLPAASRTRRRPASPGSSR